MNVHAWLTAAWLLCVACLPAAARAAGDGGRVLDADNKIALVIGNAAYTDANPLKNTANDANDMCASLKALGFTVICKIDVATKREFKDAIFEFTGKINPRSVALFYYAGHATAVDGLNYLIPVKAELRTKNDIEDEGMQVNYLMNELESRQAALNLFFLDACRDNPFANPIRGYVPMMGLASQLYAPRNSIIAMSTGAGQLSLDGDGRNGTFTKNLLQHIGAPRQPIEDMLKAVGSGTRADAARLKRRQDPQITMSFADRFCMAGCGAPAAASAASQSPDARVAADRLNELETVRLNLERKQEQIERMRADVARQQATIDAANQELATRAVKAPDAKAPPVTVVPTF